MRKLLLADDSVTIQRVIELTFSGEDIQVVAVNDGEQAIARIPSEHPDIVLADIGMPKKGGYDVAAFVKGRADLEHIPVLLLAGAFEPVDQARAELVRCDGVLIKPFEPRQVIERVRELLDGMKSSPAPATGDVLRPVEQLVPRPEPQLASVASIAPQLAPSPASAPPSVPQTDLTLDDYFESLNSAFESVAQAGTPSIAKVAEPPIFELVRPTPVDPPDRSNGAATPHPLRRRGDALDDCFDRLSTAFEQAKPSSTPQPLDEEFEEDLDELAEAPRVPTLDSLVGVNGGADGNGGGSHLVPRMNGRHELAQRNPIVEALEAMLAAPDVAPAVPAPPPLPGLPDALAAGNGSGPVRSDLADAVTERVLDRLVPEITATVQRLVQEEVDRIRRHH